MINLKLEYPVIKGPAVRRLQELGDSLGFDYGPNDGIFGPQTDRVVRRLQQYLGVRQDGIVGPETWGAIDIVSGRLAETNWFPVHTDTQLVDTRNCHELPKNYAYDRPWAQIQGVTLHQTGCMMPYSARGWDRVNAHYGVTQAGTAILINDPSRMIWHAQGLSRTTIGIEFEGNYCGIEGDLGTLWQRGGGPQRLTDRMIDAADLVFDDILKRFHVKNYKWLYVYAHRQSSKNRRGDPGSEIWQKIAIPWMKRLDATPGPARYKIGTGRPIPVSWCEFNGKGAY